MIVELIPPKERLGYCEGCREEVRVRKFVTERKPMFLVDGRPLCRSCTKTAQRRADVERVA